MASFVDDLAAEFGISGSDRDELFLLLERADRIYELSFYTSPGGQWSEEEADALDELEEVLWPTVYRLRELEYALAWAQAVSEHGANIEHSDTDAQHRHEQQLSNQTEFNRNQIRTMTQQLAKCGRLAQSIPRLRRRKGQRRIRYGNSERAFDFDTEPLRVLMDEIVYFWTVMLGRSFKQDHSERAWGRDSDGRPVPTEKATDAVRFSFKVMDHIASGSGAHLKTLARRYTSK